MAITVGHNAMFAVREAGAMAAQARRKGIHAVFCQLPTINYNAPKPCSHARARQAGKHNIVIDLAVCGNHAFLCQNVLKLEKWPRRSCQQECCEAIKMPTDFCSVCSRRSFVRKLPKLEEFELTTLLEGEEIKTVVNKTGKLQEHFAL